MSSPTRSDSGVESPLSILSRTPSLPDSPFFASFHTDPDTIHLAASASSSPVATSSSPVAASTPPPVKGTTATTRRSSRKVKPTANSITASSSSDDDDHAFFPGIDFASVSKPSTQLKDSSTLVSATKPAAKRGRPRRNVPKLEQPKEESKIKPLTEFQGSSKPRPKRRGRPPRKRNIEEVEEHKGSESAPKKIKDEEKESIKASASLNDSLNTLPTTKPIASSKGLTNLNELKSALKPSVHPSKRKVSEQANSSSSSPPAKKVCTEATPSDSTDPSTSSPVTKIRARATKTITPPKGLRKPERSSTRAKRLSPKALDALKAAADNATAPAKQASPELTWGFQHDGSWTEPKVLTKAEHAYEEREAKKRRGYSGEAKAPIESRVHSVAHWKKLLLGKENKHFPLSEAVWKREFGADLPEPNGYEGRSFDDDDEVLENRSGGVEERGGDETVELQQEIKGEGKEYALDAGVEAHTSGSVEVKQPTDEEDMAAMALFYTDEMRVTHHPNRARYKPAKYKKPPQGIYYFEGKPYFHSPHLETRKKTHSTPKDDEVRMEYDWDSRDLHHKQAPESFARGSFPEPKWKTDKYERELVGKLNGYSAPFKHFWDAEMKQEVESSKSSGAPAIGLGLVGLKG